MSILSQLAEKKITWAQASTQIENWFGKIGGAAPATVQADLNAAKEDLKQAASNVLGLADTALGPIIATATTAVSAAVQGALTSAIGPVAASAASPVTTTGIQQIGAALKAQIDEEIARAQAALASSPPTPPPAGNLSIPPAPPTAS